MSRRVTWRSAASRAWVRWSIRLFRAEVQCRADGTAEADVHRDREPDGATGPVEEFLDGIHANARASVRDEPGCLRFDVHRSTEQPHRFVLYEIYASAVAFYTQHRKEPHYVAVAGGCRPLCRAGWPGEHFRRSRLPRRLTRGASQGR